MIDLLSTYLTQSFNDWVVCVWFRVGDDESGPEDVRMIGILSANDGNDDNTQA